MQHDEGLDNLAVKALAQSADGRVWIGTENGLFRFDGDHVEKMRAPAARAGQAEQTAGALLATPDGRMWVGWRAGLKVWAPGTPEMKQPGSEPVPVDDGQSLAASHGGIWVVSKQRLVHVSAADGAVSVLTAAPSREDAVFSVLADGPDGPVWFGCGTQLCRWTRQGVDRMGPAEGVPRGRWASALKTRDGSLWIRSDTHVLRRAPAQTRFADVTPAGVAGRTVHWQLPMAEDAHGRVLVHTDEGLTRWSAGRWQAMGRAEGLEVAGGVHAMLIDSTGDLWLGTAGLGVLQWRGYLHWRHWLRAQGLPSDEAWSFADDGQGRVWVGSGDGAVLLDPATSLRVKTPPDGGQQVGSLIRTQDGQLWQSTFGGEIRRRRGGGPWQVVAQGLPLIYQLLEQPDGRLLAGTQGGLYLVSETASQRPRVARHALPPLHGAESELPDVRRMCAAPQGVWLATQTGLALLHPDLSWETFTQAELPGKPVTTLGCGQRGEVWVVYGDVDLWRLGPEAGQGWRAEAVRAPLLEGRLKQSLLLDRRGWLWVGTDRGLALQTAAGWQRMDRSAGLMWEDINAGALFEDEKGRVWVGTSRGISVHDEPASLSRPVQPTFRIESVRQADRRWDGTGEVRLGADQPVSIDWHVAGFAHRSASRVRYRFADGAAWSEASMDGVRFEALLPGRHRLQAQAVNPDQGTASEIATLDLVVPRPWWNTWPAWLGAVTAGVALGLVAHRRRLGALQRRKAELEALVGQRTAELQASRDELERQALTDALTGAMNRRAIMQAAEREHGRLERGGHALTVALLDIDHFKRVNDNHGHPAGDAVLVEVTRRLRAAMRPYDLLGRYGGEEFLAVMPGFRPQGDMDTALQRLRRAVGASPVKLEDGRDLQVTCSIGVACFEGAGEPLAEAIKRADEALYRAKQAGRDRVVLD